MIGWRAGLVLVLVAGAVACTPQPPARQPLVLPGTSVAPQEILAAFDRRWELAESLRAVARVTITSSQGRYSIRQTILWRRPALLRLDTFSLFNQPVMSLVADVGQLSVYYPSEGAFYQGQASADTFSRIVALPLNIGEFAPLLMGYVRPVSGQHVASISLQADEDLLLLRFLDAEGGLIQDAWVDPDRLLPRRVLRYTAGGFAAVDIAYHDIQLVAATFPAPQVLAIWLPHRETAIRIQFLAVDLNPVLSPTAFQLSPPAGGQTRPLP